MILESKNIEYEIVDIAEPGGEESKDLIQNKATSKGGTNSDPEPKYPLTPQLFCDDEYCGDYNDFDLANELDTLEQFLKLAPPEPEPEPEKTEEQNGSGDKVEKKEGEGEEEKEV